MGKEEFNKRREFIKLLLSQYKRLSDLSGVSDSLQEKTIDEGLDELNKLEKEQEEQERNEKKEITYQAPSAKVGHKKNETK